MISHLSLIPLLMSAPVWSASDADALAGSGSPMMLLAASIEDPGPPLAADRIRLVVTLDDRAVGRLTMPVVVVQQEGEESPAPITDDGSVPGDLAKDGLYRANVDVRRAQAVNLIIQDGPVNLGRITLSLPSSAAAQISLRTNEGTPALATVDLTSGNPVAGTAGGSYGGGSGSSLLLWVNIAFFIAVFAWIRLVFARVWTREVRPFMARVDRLLAERESHPPEGSEVPRKGADQG